MKAIVITKKGGPEVLELREVPTPVPAGGEVLIKVKAAGLNRSDIYSRSSHSYGGKKEVGGEGAAKASKEGQENTEENRREKDRRDEPYNAGEQRLRKDGRGAPGNTEAYGGAGAGKYGPGTVGKDRGGIDGRETPGDRREIMENRRQIPEDGGEIPGLEVSGHIEACGPGVKRWKKGDVVCALVTGGGYAQYCAVPEGQCLPIPEGVGLEEAAALPETIFTVWSNVFQTAGLRAGETLLVHGGSSGIGVTAIQLAKALGNDIYVTAGSDEKCRWCESLGAKKAINYKTEDFEEGLRGIGIDVILDMTGGDFTPKNIRLLREGGRIAFINAMRGNESTVNLAEIMRKRLVLTGAMLKPRDITFKTALAAEVERNVWPLIARGTVKPIIYKILPLEEAAAAQRLMESSEHTGKILLRVS